MAAPVDTNVLVYRFDSRDRRKQKIATELLRRGLADRSIRIAHQAIAEFYAAVTRPIRGHGPLLSAADATRETEALLVLFDILYPSDRARDRSLRRVTRIPPVFAAGIGMARATWLEPPSGGW